MMRYTVQVVIAAVGILSGALLSVGDTYAASNATTKKAGPTVVDANNNLVGDVIGASSPGTTNFLPTNATIVLNISVPSIVVQVTPNNFFGNAYMYFVSSNCSGQPYFVADGLVDQPNLFPIVGVVGGNLYRIRANSAPAAINVSSIIGSQTGSLSPSNSCIDLGSVQINGVIADFIFNLNTQFTPPYRFVP